MVAFEDATLERRAYWNTAEDLLGEFLASHPNLLELRMPTKEGDGPRVFSRFRLTVTDLPFLTSFQGVLPNSCYFCSHPDLRTLQARCHISQHSLTLSRWNRLTSPPISH
jgi:hypothetical protein